MDGWMHGWMHDGVWGGGCVGVGFRCSGVVMEMGILSAEWGNLGIPC